MFRSRRSSLVKRLWKCRPKSQDETTCSVENNEDLEVKAVIHSMLKRLKERQLEVLVQAVESKGGETTGCVLLPKGELRLGRRTVAPHVLCCQTWRWSDLTDQPCTLKQLHHCCTPTEDPSYVCCNPYHWSRLFEPDMPPPPYCRTVLEQKQDDGGTAREPVSTETGGTPTAFQSNHKGPGGATRGRFWCNIAYWEMRQRVGRLFTVFDPSVNVFQELPHGDGMCLSVLQQQHTSSNESIRRTREKIGFGLTLSKEPDGVWVYNRSAYPIFVNSPTLDIPNSRTLVVRKVLPGYSLKIFDYERSAILERTRDPDILDGPYDPNAVRISFAKGWGPCYSRQFITTCPCWIEVLLSVNR